LQGARSIHTTDTVYYFVGILLSLVLLCLLLYLLY